MRLILYANGNAENHGCEALSRSVLGLFPGDEIVEYISNIRNENAYLLPAEMKRCEQSDEIETAPFWVKTAYKIAYKLKMKKLYFYILYHQFYKSLQKEDVCLSMGGDNYCYAGLDWLIYLNYWITRKAKNVLLGASIDPQRLSSRYFRKDLKRYSLIIARESLTYEALVNHGFGDRTVLLPDPAFLLKTEATELPTGFAPGNTVGINISPMIMDYEENQGMAYWNYEELVRYILEHTDMSVALIPHVVWKNSDDRIPLQRLYDTFGSNSRVCIIEDQNCMRLKYVISQCRFFVGARTHATIAAYSTCVPTLVVGYSVKAKGIAKDLFGTYENYVLPVQDLTKQDELTRGFGWILDNEESIRLRLKEKIPEWIAKAGELSSVIYKL